MSIIKKNILLVLVVLGLSVGGGFYFLNQEKPESTSSATTSTQEKQAKTKITIKADGQEKIYEVAAVGETALEATEKSAQVEKSGEGENAFITSINGRKAEEKDREFWKLVINGEDSQVGAGSYTIKENDVIVWEIDTY